MHWTLKKSGLVAVTVAILLTTWTNCEARLWEELFPSQKSCASARRESVKDCTSGKFSTRWRRWDGCCNPPQSAPEFPANPGSGTAHGQDSASGGGIPGGGNRPVLVIPDPASPGSPGTESPIPVPTLNPPVRTRPAPDGGAQGTTFPLPPIHPENRDLQDRTLHPGHTPIGPDHNTGKKPVRLPDTFVPTQPPPVPVPKSKPLELPAPTTGQAGFHSRPSIPGTTGFVPMRTLRVPAARARQQALYGAPQLTGYPVRSHHSETGPGTSRDGWRVMRPYYD